MPKVTNHRSASVGLGRLVSLQPGANEIAAEVWARVKDQPFTVAMLAAGKVGGLTVDGPAATPAPSPVQPPVVAQKAPPVPVKITNGDTTPPAGKPTPKPEPVKVPNLGAMTANEAARAVAECADRKTLAEWLRHETRKRIVTAIDKRLAALKHDGA